MPAWQGRPYNIIALYKGVKLENESGDASATLNRIMHDGFFPFVFIRVYLCGICGYDFLPIKAIL